MTVPEEEQRADRAAVAVLEAQAAAVEANLPGCLEDADPDHLHDLRVAGRRSRSVLGQLSRVFPRDERRAHARSLRWLQARTGPTRDLDVQLMEWGALVSRMSTLDREALQPVHDLLRARRAETFAAMHLTLSGRKFEARWSAWRAFLARDSAVVRQSDQKGRRDAGRPIQEVAGGRIRSLHRRMLRTGGEIDGSSPAAELHDLRKRGKELRYLLELFGDIWPADQIRPALEALKGLQDALGDHQDREVQVSTLQLLEGGLGEDGDRGTVRALDLAVQLLREDQRQARDRFADRFGAFAAVPVVPHQLHAW